MSGIRTGAIRLTGLAAVWVLGTVAAGQAEPAKPPVVLDPVVEQRWIDQLKPAATPANRVRLANHIQKKRRGGFFGRRRALTGADIVFGRQSPQQRRSGKKIARKRSIDRAYLPKLVDFDMSYAPGTVVVDTASRFLYLVLENGRAKRYGVGVGRDGFGWTGRVSVGRKAEWPGWTPPPEMRKRQPELPEHMEGGIDNPLGARALYLFKDGRDTIYRIHGSNEPWTIGQAVSSGCFRMRNEDVTELYERVGVGTRVIVI